MGSAPYAIINFAALQHNLEQVRTLTPNSRVMAVIKANGYGHGILRVARALEAADALAVARVDEGVALRQAGIVTPVVVLEGGIDQDELALASANKLELVVHNVEQISLLRQSPVAPITCWLKVDTGMHRLGVALDSAIGAYRELAACTAVVGQPRLMTHFANADNLGDPTIPRQWHAIQPLAAELAVEVSCANSGGILGWPETHADWVRPGLMLYGVSPFTGGRAVGSGLQPVMSLHSRLIAVNHYSKGDAIGYGGTWICPEDMAVGVVSIGYGDGYPRHAAAGTPVLINDKLVPLVGRVSMDMISVDLRDCPAAQVNDTVTLWGAGLPVEEIAETADTIPYQLLCGVTARVDFMEEM
ncbi:Alanine racemase [hydrothermal vent metagenome]|uniref:alanine racemase n=1 Tax=hydrothermal vent metagenome TaxID=652676 RepID=A0A3B1BC40_9ZZZZ